MKKILVKVDNIPTFYLEVFPETKIKEIKNTVKGEIVFYIDRKTTLNVFNSDEYDNEDLSSVFPNLTQKTYIDCCQNKNGNKSCHNIFQLKDFDKFTKEKGLDWKRMFSIDMAIVYLFVEDIIRFEFDPSFPLRDDIDLFVIFFQKEIENASKKLQALGETRKKTKKGKNIYYGVFTGQDIIDLFDPLLLEEFKKLNINLTVNGENFETNRKITVGLSHL